MEITPIGFHNFRGNHEKKFGIKVDDRRRHIYVVGKTGVGKSTLLENMAIADMRSGKGLAIIDPHGELAEKMLDFVPEDRMDDVIYFDPSDLEHPFAFNPMEQVGTEYRHLVASGIMSVFKKIWIDAWSARMEYILNNTLLALLEYPDSTLLNILRMFSEPEYRKKIVSNLQDPVIKAFWQNEFARYSQKLETEALAAIQNKVGQFVSNPLIRNILGQPRSTLNMRQIMDTGKIFIANLSKGKMGEDNSTLLGAMIITRLQLAAMSRVDLPEDQRRDFFMYVDEFQNFATGSFASILSEARKYHLSLTLAHQYIGQLVTSEGDTKVRDAVFGNVGTIITFRVGATDAEFLEKEFMPEFVQQDLVNLAKANVYVKLMIDGVSSRPFSAETLPPQPTPLVSYRDVIIKNAQEKYGTPRRVVEERIATEWGVPSTEAVGEKTERRGEQRLSEVLRPRQDVPRSGSGYSSGAPRSFSGGSNGGAGRGGDFARPPREPMREPRFASQNQTRSEAPSRSQADYSQRTPGDSRPPREPRPDYRPAGSVGRDSRPPMREPRFASENNRPQQPRFETPAQGEPSPESEGWQPLLKAKPPVVAPTREENEQSHQNLVSMTPVMKDAGPAPIPKKYPKPSLDISALRQAINESLKKQKSATDSQEPQP